LTPKFEFWLDKIKWHRFRNTGRILFRLPVCG